MMTRFSPLFAGASLLFAAVNLSAGCAGARSGVDAGGNPPAVLAFTRSTSDVGVSPAGPAMPIVTVEPISEAVLNDPVRMLQTRVWLERQIGFQTRSIAEPRYQALVRPRLRHALQAAGLSAAEVDGILRGVDYHRSL